MRMNKINNRDKQLQHKISGFGRATVFLWVLKLNGSMPVDFNQNAVRKQVLTAQDKHRFFVVPLVFLWVVAKITNYKKISK